MPLKRPAPNLHSNSGSRSQSDSESPHFLPPSKHSRVSPSAKALPHVKIYIVQAKLDPSTLSELFLLADRNAECLCHDAEEADVIVTAIGMRRRLERHIPWSLAKRKAIVTPQWLRDSVKHGAPLPCGDYAAIQDLRAETAAHCPECNLAPCACSDSSVPTTPAAPSGLQTPPASARSSSLLSSFTSSTSPRTSAPTSRKSFSSVSTTHSEPSNTLQATPHINIPVNLLPPDPPIPTDVSKLNYASRYACQRASPLQCPNPDLISELDIMHRARALEGEERSALSYARAVSVLKAYPDRITSLHQVQKLPFIGVKIGAMVEEYLETGKINEAQTNLASERFRCLSLLSSIYGIGPATARQLYALGLRSLEDLEVYYGVERQQPSSTSGEMVELEIEKSQRRHGHARNEGARRKTGGEKGGDVEGLEESWIRLALELREDLSIKVRREEVVEIGRVVMAELNDLQPGCVSTIVGGHRRGKPESNDVDIVFTHPDGERIQGLCKRFVRRLHERGMVTHVMHVAGFHEHNPLRSTHWDTLEKALTIFVLPESSTLSNGIRRRLDLIFAPPETYWTAVIGWTGSVMFQRDLRQWAKDKLAMKFDSSGITRRHDSKPFFPKTEKEIFDLFGLEWVDPTWRNADA